MSSEPTTPSGRQLLRSLERGMPTTVRETVRNAWSVGVARDALRYVEAEAVAAYRADLEAKVRAIYTAYDYEGLLHSPHCNRIVFSGSTGPDPEPPDPCSCDGPAVLRLLTDGAEPPEGASE